MNDSIAKTYSVRTHKNLYIEMEIECTDSQSLGSVDYFFSQLRDSQESISETVRGARGYISDSV